MNVSANFWKTMRTARVKQLIHCGTDPVRAESMAKIEITNRKRFSREYEPWAGVLATVEVEEDDEGQPRWLAVFRGRAFNDQLHPASRSATRQVQELR